MKNLIVWLFAAVLLVSSGCLRVPSMLPASSAPAGPTRAEKKLQKLIGQYPELSKPDTIRRQVAYQVPAVEVRTQYISVRDTVWLRQESSQLDTLINNLQTSLDSTQQAATRAKLHHLLVDRPVLRDTLCFDTLGIHGRIWLQGRTYKIQLARDAIGGTVSDSVVVQKLQGCPPVAAAHYGWYNPAGWAIEWWAWLLIGLFIGLFLAIKLR